MPRLNQGTRNSAKRVCMPNTCANKGVCKEAYDDDILNAAFVRQQYLSNDGEDDWMAASLIPLCDCDLTTYTGPTCLEGNETCISVYLVGRTR